MRLRLRAQLPRVAPSDEPIPLQSERAKTLVALSSGDNIGWVSILIGYFQFENERNHDCFLVAPVFLCGSSSTPRRESPKLFLEGCVGTRLTRSSISREFMGLGRLIVRNVRKAELGRVLDVLGRLPSTEITEIHQLPPVNRRPSSSGDSIQVS
jgi:hypothetical protein